MGYPCCYIYGSTVSSSFLQVSAAIQWIRTNHIGWLYIKHIHLERNATGLGTFYYILMFMMSVFTALTYLIDRFFSKHIKGPVSTLVFPALFVLMEFIVVSTNPSGSYGTLAHTQTSITLQQIFSITGIWGLVFFITWSASMINWLWEHNFERGKLNIAFFIYGIPTCALVLFGQIRLTVNPEHETVRVASITKIKSNSSTQDSRSEFLENSTIAAASGARIVFGSETAVVVQAEEEDGFVEKARALARARSIFLGLPMQVIPPEFPERLPENKIVWISPNGEEIFTYHKARPTPGEGDYGDDTIRYFDSSYGRIASAICFDMDFPSYIKQVNEMDIDLLLVPGSDWKEISPYHTFVASSRAIEQGFNMVRATANGLSAAFTYKGQLLSSRDDFKTKDPILYSDVPTRGYRTVYSRLGDYFPWICILFLLGSSAIVTRSLILRKAVHRTKK